MTTGGEALYTAANIAGHVLWGSDQLVNTVLLWSIPVAIAAGMVGLIVTGGNAAGVVHRKHVERDSTQPIQHVPNF